MISWIQRYFQRHFRIIFAVLLAVTIISFIFTIGSTPGIGRADRRVVIRDYFGHNLASQEELAGLLGNGRVSAYLQYGSDATGDQLQSYALQRAAALHFADEMHIPTISDAEVTDYIKSLRIFSAPDGRFDVSRYNLFRSGLRAAGFFSEPQIARVIREDARLSKIQQLLAGPGYVLPGEVRSVIAKADTTWTITTATASYADFDAGAGPTDAEISKFFTDNAFRYTVPPRVSVDCVRFPTEAFLAQSAPTDGEVREYYDANPGKFQNPAPAAKAPPAKPDPAADFKAKEPIVRVELQLQKAKRAAVKAASDLAYAVYEGKVTRGAPLDAFLAERKLKASSLAAFTREAGPAEFGGSREIANAAFELSADRFYSEGIPGPDGAVVLFWKESLPAHAPALADVREKVRADAVDDMKRRRFTEFGRTLKAAVERRMKAGDPFEKAAAAAAAPVKLAVKSYPPFTFRDQPHDVDQSAIDALGRLDKGGVSDMAITADKGLLVYAADKKVPALSESSPRYVEVRGKLASVYSQTDSYSILAEVTDRELKRSDEALKKAIP